MGQRLSIINFSKPRDNSSVISLAFRWETIYLLIEKLSERFTIVFMLVRMKKLGANATVWIILNTGCVGRNFDTSNLRVSHLVEERRFLLSNSCDQSDIPVFIINFVSQFLVVISIVTRDTDPNKSECMGYNNIGFTSQSTVAINIIAGGINLYNSESMGFNAIGSVSQFSMTISVVTNDTDSN